MQTILLALVWIIDSSMRAGRMVLTMMATGIWQRMMQGQMVCQAVATLERVMAFRHQEWVQTFLGSQILIKQMQMSQIKQVSPAFTILTLEWGRKWMMTLGSGRKCCPVILTIPFPIQMLTFYLVQDIFLLEKILRNDSLLHYYLVIIFLTQFAISKQCRLYIIKTITLQRHQIYQAYGPTQVTVT